MKKKIFSLFYFLMFFILAIQSPRNVFAQTKADYDYYLAGGTVNSSNPNPASAVMLIGGSEVNADWEIAATEWFLQNADGGDYLVIRSDGTGSQASWVWSNFNTIISSAAELSINNANGANDPAVEQYILDAEAIFIAGGDQDEYENYWKNTKVEDALNYLINTKKIPIGGTSAGMAILGESYYAPSGTSCLSSEILNNPYHSFTSDIFHGDFIHIPYLNNVITETHADREHGTSNENRYGRAFGFLARVTADNGNQIPSYAIVCEEAAFVCIDANGIANVYGNGSTDGCDAYFLQTNGSVPETIQSGSELIWYSGGQAVKSYHIEGTQSGSGSFDLNDWYTASGGDWEDWYTTGGYSGFNYRGGSCSDCTGADPPNGGSGCNVPSGLSSSNISSTSADVSWNSTGALSYDLRYKPSAETNWTETNLSSSSTTLINLSPDTEYEFQVRSNCSGSISNFSSSAFFTTLTDQVTYCTTGGNDFSYEWIAEISFADLTHASGAQGYSDFTDLSAQAEIGAEYSISLTPGFSGSSYTEVWRVWIDYNNDGDFDDQNETAFAPSGSSNTVNGTIQIPADISPVTTRMRISMRYNTAPSSCGSFDYGEAEDYTIIISEASQPQNEDPTAVANGPYNGTVDTPVAFSSAGSYDPDGSINEYLWDFGDGSTSTSANPSHTYTSADTYTVSLRVTDNDGATNTDVTSATINQNGGGEDELAFTDFENGWGIWTDGGRDCRLYTGGSRAYSGSNAANIQDNSGVSSSFYLTDGIDVHTPGYVQLEVSFYFYPYSMENGEDFWVQYFNGSSWYTVRSFKAGTDFTNYSFYSAHVFIDESEYTFPNDMKIRFLCDASGNADDIYIDDITIKGSTAKSSGSYASVKKLNTLTRAEINTFEIDEEGILLYPNPARNILNLHASVLIKELMITDLSGRILKQMSVHDMNVSVPVSKFPAGMYLIHVYSEDGHRVQRFLKY